jgi:solute:Na+ symporter, SSS family
LRDVYEYNPVVNQWRRRADLPVPRMAGAAAAIGQSHVFILSGADGSLMARADQLKLDHPGFPRRLLAYHTITDTWIDAGETPANPVTTPCVRWGDRWILASGESKPRVRTTQVWSVTPAVSTSSFGAVNSTVLGLYLLAMVGVGLHFMRRNRNTDDYFRGGKRMLWWAAGCSIFATMLSSVTYLAIPAKAYAQDHVYLVGNLTIPMVAPIAVYLALPFFRRIDATSAYEYLEKRFNRPVRWIASSLFTLFHVFRMGIVMSLAALALAAVTPLTPAQCVLIMGVLSIVYCTLGGVEAVIWTDTIQTVVLLGGALLCLAWIITGADGGLRGFLDTAYQDGKLHLFNFHLDATSASLAIWVVVVGGIGQNVSSYTADQAVVQRYMTTPNERRAARSIWFAAWLAVPASLLFFFMGTALYVFYKSNPHKLDPAFMTDQIFPLFMARELPIGVAGLIVAGVFAAAQSTVSSSMNSTATAVVTDFLRPLDALKTERAYLNTARMLTLFFGVLGTVIGLLFVNPGIRSLFDQFLRVLGLFMGVLGGLFALGVLTRRARAYPTLMGAIVGVAVMFSLPFVSKINGYLYAAIGIAVCFITGYGLSLLAPAADRDLRGLTLHTLNRQTAPPHEPPAPGTTP